LEGGEEAVLGALLFHEEEDGGGQQGQLLKASQAQAFEEAAAEPPVDDQRREGEPPEGAFALFGLGGAFEAPVFDAFKARFEDVGTVRRALGGGVEGLGEELGDDPAAVFVLGLGEGVDFLEEGSSRLRLTCSLFMGGLLGRGVWKGLVEG